MTRAAMRLLRLFGLLGTASCLALGEGMPSGAPATADAGDPGIAGALFASGRAAADLDFNDDFPVSPGTRLPKPAGTPAAPPPAAALGPAPAPRAWLYWTLGLSAAAAAGGTAWFMHDALDKAEAPKRSTEVFTDDPD